MSGIEGERLVVTKEELSKHNTENDAWISIFNKGILKNSSFLNKKLSHSKKQTKTVYNMTEYLKYHPGGKEILLDFAGKEATSAFNDYHKWVNYSFILEKCYIGILGN